MNFKQHVTNSVAKGNAAIRTLYPLLVKNNAVSIENKITIYKQIIRPLVWSHLFNCAMEPLEVVQNKCLRMALKVLRFTRVADLQEAADIPPIKKCIKDLATNFFLRNHDIKYIQNIINCKLPNIKHKLMHEH